MLSNLHMCKALTAETQRKMQTIVNNIANVNTPSFKGNKYELESLFPHVMTSVLADMANPEIPLIKKKRRYHEFPQSMRVLEIKKDMSQGTFEVTNRPMDLAIEGNGFFQFRMDNGTVAYGRAGNLHMDADGNLMDPHQHLLEPPIQVPKNTSEITIDASGKVFAHRGDEAVPREIGQIQIATFQNTNRLRSVGQNLYTATPDSGEPDVKNPGEPNFGLVRQGNLELSNVNLVEQMMEMLMTQRDFELGAGAVNAGNEIVKYALEIPK